MNKNYRIHTNIISDTLLHVNMRQDFDFMEILSLKLSQKDAYKIHSSNYGVIIGRVLANDAFGIPNAKISVFIEKDGNDTTDVENLYPYEEITGKDKEGRRYNLLPDDSDDECYRIVGTFPNKRLLLDDNTYLEVYDKYWKYSTVTNNAGDYMIFGIPAGNQQIHVDIDMSDIGILSQKPRDYMYKGYTETLFESSTQFKKSTNLDNLTQIFSQNKSVYVYPFWGDADNGVAAITRADIQINYKFEPTCVFMGSIVSDNDGNSIDHKCGGMQKSGFNRQLVAGEGTIEMIRKTQDGLVEEYPIQGNRLIDSDGVWCYQIPMNLDFVGTDEYGNIVPTDNSSKGIPTRTQVRFRISKTETGGEGFSNHTAKYLVPMNPVLSEEETVPTTEEKTGQEIERMYNFGSNTPQSCFRDLYWNNVYSVKNFIPKTQVAKRGYSPYYNALKACNAIDNQNPVPFNKLMINIPFTYMFICLLFTIVVTIITFVNKIINLLNDLIALINSFLNISIFGVEIFSFGSIGYIGCVPMQAGTNSENKVYYPGCDNRGMNAADCPDDMDSCKKVNDKEELMDVIQQNLSQEYDVVRLDLFQDWLNGCLYMPLWFWKKTKKKKFLFFTIKKAQNQFCNCDKEFSKLKTKVTCNMNYISSSLGTNRETVDLKESKWHKTRDKAIGFFNGLIKRVENSEGESVYYYTAYQPSSNNKTKVSNIKQRKTPFQFVRLFATDIILLGNINKSNIYGIPQLFDNLPSTTSNIPPIATIEESDETDTDTKKKVSDNDMTDTEEGGKTIITGMDWGYSGSDDTPIYKKGLFLDLACLYADTRSKACINVERMSELGVGLDMSYKMAYAKGSDIVEGVIDSDGFINKFEINDNEARAMFATLNHVGFIPQDYQDEKDMYTTQVTDDNTHYLVPKFKYVYPVDFDGRMTNIMENYDNGSAQPLLDNVDESYVTFRLGAEKEENHGRKRHFYYKNNDRSYEMPLYNNSFYFYFGINKGNTAIDKFTNKFIAPCAKDTKKPFTIITEPQGEVACKDIYAIESYKEPYIDISVDDIQVPYSYELINSNGITEVKETNKLETKFRIPDADSRATRDVVITNQTYTLKITDGNGKKLTERIVVSTPSITIDYETQKLGTKFYSTAATRIDYICSDDTMAYGKIIIKSFSIDGYEFNITDALGTAYDQETNSYVISVSGTSNAQDGDEQNIFISEGTSITLVLSTNKSSVRECMCDSTSEIAQQQAPITDMINWWGVVQEEENPKHLELYVYQPNSFLITATQMCDGVETNNTITEMAVIQNGEIFNAYLNKMPLRFMVGTLNDSKAGTIMNQSNFYRTTAVTEPNGAGLNGWFGVHQEDTYKFLPTTSENAPIWEDYVSFNGLISSLDVKKKLLKYKFETMFSVADSTYVTTASPNRYEYRAQGGVGIPLNRAVYPVYDESKFREDNGTTYVLSDRGTIYGSVNYPNIVGNNYKGINRNLSGPSFNRYVRTGGNDGNPKYQGNYVAVFSNNGGYINNKETSNKIPVIKLPNFTKVSPMTAGGEKVLGKDVKGNLDRFRPAYTKDGQTLPYLRTMFVDRRLDYDLTIFGPAIGAQKIHLYPYQIGMDGSIIECGYDRIWKNARISGTTYGGIEMAYDSGNDSFMSGDTEEEKVKLEIVDTMFGKVIRNASSKQKIADVSTSTSDQPDYNTFVVGDETFIIGGNTWKDDHDVDHRIGSDGWISLVEENYTRSSRKYSITLGEEYNILTATSEDYNVSATTSPLLEYTYKYSSDDFEEDVKTVYNPSPMTSRRLYEATLNGADIREAFWSTPRRESMWTYGGIQNQTKIEDYGGYDNEGNPQPYYFKYPYANLSLYNGDFDRDTMNVNYPTKRYIDVGNVPALAGYSGLYLTSCSYNTKPTINDETGELNMKTTAGESLELDFGFDSIVTMTALAESETKSSFFFTFLKPISSDDIFGHVTYTANSSTFIHGIGDYYSARVQKILPIFYINTFEVEGYNVYNHTPRLIRVLPYTGQNLRERCYPENNSSLGLDGISYIKMSCSYPTDPNSSRPTYEGVNRTLDDAIRDVTVHKFGYCTWIGLYGKYDCYCPETVGWVDTIRLKNGMEITDWFFTEKDSKKPLTSDSYEFNNILFGKEISPGNIYENDGVGVFAILLQREYESTTDDNLTKHIRTLEFSSLFDCRPLEFKPDVLYGTDSGHTYVDYQEAIVDGVTVQKFIQTLSFKFRFNEETTLPLSRNCEAFANVDSMSYTIYVKNRDESYSLDAEAEYIPRQGGDHYGYLILTSKWTEEMGIIPDKQWKNDLIVTIVGKTREGFTYKINEVHLEGGGFTNGFVTYDPNTRTGTGFENGKKYNVSILLR